MEKNKEIFGLPVMFWGLWVTLLILWMGRFVTSFLSMYLVSDMHVSAGVAGTIVSMYGFGGMRLLKYNYSDSAWTDYVKAQGGNLSYE